MNIVIGTPSKYRPSRSLHNTPREKLKEGDYWLTYYSASEPSGSLRVERYENTYVIREVIVDPEHRGKGIGRTMMEHILRFLKPKGRSIFLYVDSENKVAISLYKSLGFALVKKGARFGDKYQYME